MSREEAAVGYTAGSQHQGWDEEEKTACNSYLEKNSLPKKKAISFYKFYNTSFMK